MPTDARTPNPRGRRGLLSFAARIYWMLLGIGPILAAVSWMVDSKVYPSSGDALYWAGILAMIGVRWLDIAFLDGTRADGEPASRRDGWRYSQSLILGGGGAYLAILFIGSRL